MRGERGLGSGKMIGPGGRLDPGESALQGATREAQGKLNITFQFVDGPAMLVSILTATGCEGDPQASDEATPLWMPLEQTPYDRMWADDRVWFPLMLAGQPFHGRSLFDGKTLLGHHVILRP
jgi:8-oxo-dGTP diphosphatase